MDYLPEYNALANHLPKEEWNWQIQNISAMKDFKVTYTEAYGSSNSVSAKTVNDDTLSVGGGFSFDTSIPIKGWTQAFTPQSLGTSGAFNFSFKSKLESINRDVTTDQESKTWELTDSMTANTLQDDIYSKSKNDINIWKYRIINAHVPDAEYVDYEVSDPQPFKQTLRNTSGKTYFEFYQPWHQNGSILTYPQISADPNKLWYPDDVGNYRAVDTSQNPDPNAPYDKTTYYDNSGLLNQNVDIFQWPSSVSYTISNKYANSNLDSFEHYDTFKHNEEISFGLRYKWGLNQLGLGGGTVGGDITGTFSQNWSNSSAWTKQFQTTIAQTITINTPGIVNSQNYQFKPYVYFSEKGGGLRVAFAAGVSMDSTSGPWWRAQYNRLPDPALNLPNRLTFNDATAAWELTGDEERRQQMRGYFIRTSDANRHPLLDETEPNDLEPWIVKGDDVDLCARVYNLSLGKDTGKFKVKFYYRSYDLQGTVPEPMGKWKSDQAGLTQTVNNLVGVRCTPEVYDRNEGLCKKDFVSQPGDVSRMEVCAPFKTSSLQTYTEDSIGYRFKVVLDESNEVEELHELYDADGTENDYGNNVGIFPLTNPTKIHTPDETFDKKGGSEEAPPYPVETDIWMEPSSLGIEIDGELYTDGEIEVEQGCTYLLRASALTEGDHRHSHITVFYFKDMNIPGQTLGLIEGHKLGGLLADRKNHVWGNWTPKEVGKYELHALVFESGEDPRESDADDSLTVTVVPASGDRDDDAACGCNMSAGGGKDGTPVLGLLFVMAALAFRSFARRTK